MRENPRIVRRMTSRLARWFTILRALCGVKLLVNLHLCVGLWIALFALPEASAQVVRPIPVPGRIEAENYDTNGPGISFYDDTAGNSGSVYRSDDVDI